MATNARWVVSSVNRTTGTITITNKDDPPYQFNRVSESVSLAFDGAKWTIVSMDEAYDIKPKEPTYNEWGEVSP